MTVRYPRPLQPGDRVGVTSPSSGVDDALRPRLDVAVRTVSDHGYDVVVGDCMDGGSHVSAPAEHRAAELTEMLTDPAIRAVVPPWGGETAIDLLPLLDWDAIGSAEPTWVVGFSDLSTVITPLTLLTGTATLHGNNLMDTPYRVPDGLLGWLDVVTRSPGESFTQTPPNRHRSTGWVDYAEVPEVSELNLDGEGRWTRLDGDDPVTVEGRLVGGCIGERGARRTDRRTRRRLTHPEGGGPRRAGRARRADRRRRGVRPRPAVPAPGQRCPGPGHLDPRRRWQRADPDPDVNRVGQ